MSHGPPSAFDWRSVHLLLGVPCASRVEPATVQSLIQLVAELGRLGARTDLSIPRGFLVADARNALAARVFRSPAVTHLVQVDTDVSFEPNVVVRMLQRGVDIIGTPVRMKSEELRYNVRFLRGGAAIEHGALRVSGVGTGLHLATRSALEQVATVSPTYKIPDGELVVGVFDSLVDETGTRLLDDYAFAHRARSVGLDVWALLNAKTTHHDDATTRGWPGELTEAELLKLASQVTAGAPRP